MKRKVPAISDKIKDWLNTSTFKYFQESFDFNLYTDQLVQENRMILFLLENKRLANF